MCSVSSALGISHRCQPMIRNTHLHREPPPASWHSLNMVPVVLGLGAIQPILSPFAPVPHLLGSAASASLLGRAEPQSLVACPYSMLRNTRCCSPVDARLQPTSHSQGRPLTLGIPSLGLQTSSTLNLSMPPKSASASKNKTPCPTYP